MLKDKDSLLRVRCDVELGDDVVHGHETTRRARKEVVSFNVRDPSPRSGG